GSGADPPSLASRSTNTPSNGDPSSNSESALIVFVGTGMPGTLSCSGQAVCCHEPEIGVSLIIVVLRRCCVRIGLADFIHLPPRLRASVCISGLRPCDRPAGVHLLVPRALPRQDGENAPRVISGPEDPDRPGLVGAR